jgi:hypothetical protein
MLNEKLKSYMECENCWKTKNCPYYKDVKATIDKFKDTPLNIHFPLCNEHESYLYKAMNEIEKSTDIPKFKQEYDCIWVGKEKL